MESILAETNFFRIVLILVGAAFVIGGIWAIIRHVRHGLDCQEKIEVKIAKMLPESDGDDGTSYRPVYKYEYKEQTYIVTGQRSYGTEKYKPGDKLELRIDSSDPERIFEPKYIDAYLLSAVFIIFGIAILYVGITGRG